MTITGTIVDQNSGNPLPGASIVVVNDDGIELGYGASANNKGEFYMSHPLIDGNNILITYVSYLPTILPAELFNASDYPEVGMTVLGEELPPVTVTPAKKEKYFLWWVLGGGAVFLLLLAAGEKKKKRVGAIGNSDWKDIAIKVGIGVAAYFLIVKPILVKLGILDSKEDAKVKADRLKAIDDSAAAAEAQQPTTFTPGQLSSMADSLYESMRYSWLDDDYDTTEKVLKQVKNLSDVYKLMQYFGIREECLFGVICTDLSLPEMVKRNLSSSRIKSINEDYAAKGIQYTW